MKTFISLIVVLALALLSLWLQDIFQQTPIVKTTKDEHFPDYFMENFRITNMNNEGQPDYILKAERMLHYADDGSTEVSKLHIEFIEQNGNWTIAADRALLQKDSNIIHLYDQVKVRRSGSDSRDPLSIDTEYLKIHTENKVAETDQLAHLKTQDFELDTQGMVFDNRQGILKLISSVKGRYAPVK